MKKSKMTWSRALVGSAVVLAFLMAGCEIVSAPSEAYLQPNGGTGSVTLNIGLAGAVPVAGDPALSRTVYPTGENEEGLTGYITKYVVSFAGGTHANVEVPEEGVQNNGASVTIDNLAAGDYTVTVTGYAMLGEQGQETETEVAKGSVGVKITAGEAAQDNTKSIILGPSGEGQGTFSYEFDFYEFDFLPVDAGTLYIYEEGEADPVEDGEVDLIATAGSNKGSKTLAAGTYQAAVLLAIGEDVAWRGETVHVYAGKTSPWTHTFMAEEFLPPTAVSLFALGGLFDAPITDELADEAITPTAQYTGTIAWTYEEGTTKPLAGPFVKDTAYTAVLSLKAKPGYTFVNVAATSFSYGETAGTGETGTGTELKVSIAFTALADVATVNLLELKTLFAPPIAEELPGPADIETAQYTGTIAWKSGESLENDLEGAFVAGTAYTAVLSLNAKPGFTFKDIQEDGFTYDQLQSVKSDAGEGKEITVNVTFEETPELDTPETLVLTALFDPPVATVKAQTGDFVGTEEFTGSVAWTYVDQETITLEPEAKFAAETVYTAVVTLKAKPGYTFADVEASDGSCDFTYENATSVTNGAGDGKTITVTIVFPETKVTKLKIGIGLGAAKIPVKLDSDEVGDDDKVNGGAIEFDKSEDTTVVFSIDDEDEAYSAVKWYIGNTELEGGNLDVTSLLVKKHTVMVFATKDGIPYSRAIAFEVKNGE